MWLYIHNDYKGPDKKKGLRKVDVLQQYIRICLALKGKLTYKDTWLSHELS